MHVFTHPPLSRIIRVSRLITYVAFQLNQLITAKLLASD
ncbi:hypothetical protein T01_3010 [Trichinella spiralis]|uniref:Uncharacterized protein n=1 Tax=Trichinella spiralis TaxID=6334 RepID=A0A0V0Y2H6_TRISP|nr:hypothetical protein T01_3010 [Trichinella spiralis]